MREKLKNRMSAMKFIFGEGLSQSFIFYILYIFISSIILCSCFTGFGESKEIREMSNVNIAGKETAT